MGLGALLGTSSIPIPVWVNNATGESFRTRYDNGGCVAYEHEWKDVPPGQTRTVVEFEYGAICAPPNRWIPEGFASIVIEFADGTTRVIDREAFLREAGWGPGARWEIQILRQPR